EYAGENVGAFWGLQGFFDGRCLRERHQGHQHDGQAEGPPGGAERAELAPFGGEHPGEVELGGDQGAHPPCRGCRAGWLWGGLCCGGHRGSPVSVGSGEVVSARYSTASWVRAM